jgi:rubrerythrin
MDQVSEFLKQVLLNQETHAKWLNCLSYLEYRGARKIMRTLKTLDMNEEILKHAMEEIRHAFFFKNLAIKLGGEKYSYYSDETLLAPKAIKDYFYKLDFAADSVVPKTESKLEVYRFVTWLIEERAISVYQKYETLLKDSEFKISLKPILLEESYHLKEVKSRFHSQLYSQNINIKWVVQLEEQLFEKTLKELLAALKNTSYLECTSQS